MKKYSGHILIVDDDEHVVLTSKVILKNYFENIETLSTPKTLESKLKQQDFDVILLDMNFQAGVTSGNEGIFWMNRIHQLSPQTQVVMQTAYGDIELAVKSIKEGAVDFLPKPWDKEKLVTTVLNAYQQAIARKENRELKSKQKALQHHLNQNHQPFIASSASMQSVIKTIEQVASTDANVLILGENGTGKEVAARALHSQSNRSEEPFISVDLGAVPPSLFESEMFGHEKGAFTDAKEPRIGKFELANRGTLFLDEIGNLSPELQVKLLSVLQSRKVSKVGSNKVIDLDVRVICATNSPIYEAVKIGAFRQDLFYRIKTVEIKLPPLRERKEDIPLLVNHYLLDFSKRYNKELKVDSALVSQLTKYHWPGNIRELQHAVERAVILSKQSVLKQDDFQLSPSSETIEPEKTLNLTSVEREVIEQAVKKSNGNLTLAAEELGIGRTTLYRKMEEYGLTK
ncbi:MAG TPA: sigma-54 dependent transcriptional regulator [Cyclobacteriaceae bacterium]|jgi:two-component system response regulator HydG|nr:sigma-54-dependent Fis family transcriptional regulator [Cytophagales bacterium]HRE67274.1 sigma-54 dependent transcriptional regulator [Cyclobacteriaceae bacterium]HRF35506.1 sigma-54 dependent transcriptional regulator [Cyclobacteriaceae bacterium]